MNLVDIIGPVHNSHVTCFKKCPKQFDYKYLQNLEAKTESLPLKRGIWTHYCLEAQYLRWGIEDGTLLHTPESIDIDGLGKVTIEDTSPSLVVVDAEDNTVSYDLSAPGMLELLIEHVYDSLFPLEQESLVEKGMTLPEQVKTLLEGYFDYWGDSLREETVLYVECNWERSLNEDLSFEGRIDLIIKDKRDRVVVRDWKTTKYRPGPEWKLMESQLHLYPWGVAPLLAEQGLKITAVEFDWIRSVLPTKPKQNQDGSLSKAKIDTTPAVYKAALEEYGIEVDEFHKTKLAELEAKLGDYYYRQRMPRQPKVTKTILSDFAITADIMGRVAVGEMLPVRHPAKDCTWSCEFLELCQGELYGADVSNLRKANFQDRKTRARDVGTTSED